jgi:hypothetical protein
MVTLPNKTPDETKVLTFDFSPEANPTSTLTGPTVTKSLLSGTDTAAANLTLGSAAVSGLTVSLLVAGGLDGSAYKLVCKVSASNSEVHEISASLGVSSNAS